MKNLLFAIAFIAFLGGAASAQKFAYVDTRYILNNIPEYKKAQDQLDKISVEWQKEIEALYAEIDRMYKSFQAEQILLTEDLRRKREDEIVSKEKQAKDLQKKRFGPEGDLFKKRQELVKPIQDKVYNAIKEMAEIKAYDFIFDKSSDLIMLHSNPKFDKSDEIIEKLGYKPGLKEQPKTIEKEKPKEIEKEGMKKQEPVKQ
ncbi:MAG: OmpH family outer membrane protein [Bacteroidetes bacterium]|nr:OmpH family outer membrane protein [Bacteroidota bacterium]